LKEQLALLRELQDIDLKLDELEDHKNEIRSRLKENKRFLEKLETDLENQKDELEEVRSTRTKKQHNLQELNNKLEDRQNKLHKTKTGKEYEAVETEIDVIKEEIEEAEDEIERLGEVIEETEDSIEDKEEKIFHLREGIAEEEASAEEQIAELDEEVQALKDRREEARGDVSQRVLRRYDFIRDRGDGKAIAPAKDEHCENCYMAIPPQQYIELQRGDKLITCSSCQSILYFYEDALNEDETGEEAEAEEA